MVAMSLLAVGCSKAPTVLDAYQMPATEAAELVPKLVSVCWGLQAGHMNGSREAGLAQDITETCQRSSLEEELSTECRAYAAAAARYGRAAVAERDLTGLVTESDETFASCINGARSS